MKPKIESWKLRRPNAVVTLIGAPGSGKTVLAYNVADALRKERRVYCPMSERFGRPKYYRRLRWPYPDNAVIMHNDASLTHHARQWRSPEHVSAFILQQLRRHKNIDFIWDVQNSGSIDIEILRATDCLILKEPSLLQADYERPALRGRYEIAEEAMQKAGGWKVDNAYVFTHKRQFILTEIKLPSYWKKDISEDDLLRLKARWRRVKLP